MNENEKARHAVGVVDDQKFYIGRQMYRKIFVPVTWFPPGTRVQIIELGDAPGKGEQAWAVSDGRALGKVRGVMLTEAGVYRVWTDAAGWYDADQVTRHAPKPKTVEVDAEDLRVVLDERDEATATGSYAADRIRKQMGWEVDNG